MRYIKSCVLTLSKYYISVSPSSIFKHKEDDFEEIIEKYLFYYLDRHIENYEIYDDSILLNFKTFAKFNKKELLNKLKYRFDIFIKEYKYYYFTGKRFMPYNPLVTEISLPENILELPKNAFSWCKNIKVIHGINNILKFGEKSLMNTSITEICLNSKVEELPKKFCYGCCNLLQINTENIKNFGNLCFAYTKLTSINFQSTNKINYGMCIGCKNLINVLGIDKIEYVESSAFVNCNKLIIEEKNFTMRPVFYKGWKTSLITTS